MKKNYIVLFLTLLFVGACSTKEKTQEEVAENTIIPNSEYNYPEKLHPLAKEFLRKSPPRNYDTLTIPMMRKGFDRYVSMVFGEAQDSVTIKNDTISTTEARIPIRVYTPEIKTDELLSVIIYYHGGAWCFGGLNIVDHFGTSLTKMVPAVLVSVDYRLAPEHPYPAGFNDAYAALEWVAANAEHLGVDKNKIIVSGGSAGGNLAAVVALKARNRQGPNILGQLLLYPATDLYNLDSYSFKKFGQNFGLAKGLMVKSINAYVPNVEARKDPYVSPLFEKDLSNLPQAFVITAGFDPLRDEGEAYANKMKAAGVLVKLSRYDSMVHGFAEFTKIYPKQSDRAYNEIAEVVSNWVKEE